MKELKPKVIKPVYYGKKSSMPEIKQTESLDHCWLDKYLSSEKYRQQKLSLSEDGKTGYNTGYKAIRKERLTNSREKLMRNKYSNEYIEGYYLGVFSGLKFRHSHKQSIPDIEDILFPGTSNPSPDSLVMTNKATDTSPFLLNSMNSLQNQAGFINKISDTPDQTLNMIEEKSCQTISFEPMSLSAEESSEQMDQFLGVKDDIFLTEADLKIECPQNTSLSQHGFFAGSTFIAKNSYSSENEPIQDNLSP